MRKLILTSIAILLIACKMYAQSTDFRTQMNSIFENVDLSLVPSGILFDYGLNLVDDSLYNGSMIDDNIVSPQIWKSLYTDLWSSQVTTTTILSDVEDINDVIDNYAAGEATLIPVLFCNYHRISPDALDNNLVYISNDKLYDTPGRSQSPYIEQIAFAASAVQSRFETNDGVVKFVLQQDCYFSNSGLSVSSIAIDANDGQGYRSAQWGNTLSCYYSTGGNKDVKVKFTFSDNSTHYSHFTISVDINVPLKSTQYHNTQTLTINPATVRAYNGQKATGEVTIIYNGSTSTLDKPLIVFEGYDTWKILYPDMPDKNIVWESLLDGKHGTSMGYFPTGFQNSLASSGYDIVFVDYDNGTDYIQRNAYFAEAVINAVNQQKSGNESNVVMGISMGGLIARYALADMEARSVDHDTRLFISMDSPHQGANVPLGLQAMVRHLTDVKVEVGIAPLGITGKVWDIGSTYPEYSALLNLLQQPATRQMLIQQLSGFGENIYIDNSIHNTFMQEYEQLGYPKQCRNIAVSNGSGSASTSWQYTPDSDIFSLSANCDGPWWASILGPFVIAASPFVQQLWEMPIVTVASLLPGSYGVKANFNIKALPYSGTTKVYDGEIKIVKKILWLIPVSSTLTSEEINYTGNSLPWTSAQGGFMSFDTYTGEIPDNLPSCVDMPPITGKFCFIPAVSSLDIQGVQDLLKGYSAANDLPNSMFDNIYTEPSVNRVHTNFNSGNTDWIILELNEDPTLLQQSFVNKFNGCELSGDDLVCSIGATFSISDIPSGVTLSWNKSDNLSEDLNGDDYVVMKATGSGEGWVQAQLSGGGTNVFSEQKNVWVGSPSFTLDLGGEYVFGTNESGMVVVNYASDQMNIDNSTYNWSFTGPIGSITGDPIKARFYTSSQTGSGFIYYSIENTCGSTENRAYYEVESNWLLSLSISPNPTIGETTISIESADTDEINLKSASPEVTFDESTEWDLIVYDHVQSLKLKKQKLKGKSTIINTQSWKEGVYMVRVKYKDEVLTAKLVVNN